MKKLFLIATCLSLAFCGFAQDDFDDIYYNPKTAKTQKTQQKATPAATIYSSDTETYYYYPESTYIENRDVDEYNRYGGYYTSSVDTIGDAIANSPDFTYTQEIQKYYNPTIVIDNYSVLDDILASSYGNVNIIYDYGYPAFSPWYSWRYPYYGTTWCWNPYWNLGWGYGPGWSWSWGWGGWYDPWYAWGWGPGWGWGGPSYWAPSTPRPGNYTRPGWAYNTRPGTGGNHRAGVVNGAGSAGTRPGLATRPGTTGTAAGRPGSVAPGTSYTHRQPSYSGNSGLDAQHRPAATTRPGTTGTRPSTTTTRPGTTTTRPSTTTTRPSTTTRPNTNTTTTTRPSTTTRSNGGFNSGSGSFRSGGGTRGSGMGGGMRSGGGGGGGHRR